MKLKKLRDKTHSEGQPRWVWKLVWQDPIRRQERSRRIGYYCMARDRWRPPGKRLVRLSEKEAEQVRERKIREMQDRLQGLLLPASKETRELWASYCRRKGRPAGLVFEQLVEMVGSESFERFEATCQAFQLGVAETWRQVVGDWVARKESNAPQTWKALTEWFQKEGSPNAGHRTWLESRTTFDKFAELCPELVQSWQTLTRDEALVFQNRLTKAYDSPMTVRKHLANMRKLWRACRRTWVQGNPWSELAWPKAVADPDSWHYFSAAEVRVLLQKANATWKGRIRMAWKCGLRPGEIDHLRASDVDWQAGRVRICGHRADDVTLKWVPKDKDARTIPVDSETLLELKRLRLAAPAGCPYLFVTEKRWRQALALQVAGKWRRDAELVYGKKKAWDELVSAAEIQASDGAAVFYGLRKTCCCDMLTQGVPPHEVRVLMGHADLETTLLWYTKVNKTEAEKRIRKAQGGEAG